MVGFSLPPRGSRVTANASVETAAIVFICFISVESELASKTPRSTGLPATIAHSWYWCALSFSGIFTELKSTHTLCLTGLHAIVIDEEGACWVPFRLKNLKE